MRCYAEMRQEKVNAWCSDPGEKWWWYTDQGGSNGDGEKRLDCGYILKPIEFAGKLDVRWGEKVKDDSKIYGKDRVAIYWDLEEW